VTITDERLAEIARDAVVEAVRDLAHDRVGHGDLLSDEDGIDLITSDEHEAICERLEAEIRKHLPADQQ
jgi:hypothetical protein